MDDRVIFTFIYHPKVARNDRMVANLIALENKTNIV